MQTQQIASIEADVRDVLGEQPRFWRYIGYDECNYTYMPEGKQALARFGQLSDAPYRVRTHFLFCTGNCQGAYKFGSTNLYTEDRAGEPVFDFTWFDRILDAQLASGNKPLVELGFMPMDLADRQYAKGLSADWYDAYRQTGWSFPPEDYGKWERLIQTVAEHLRARYGEAEVNSWEFELWNEPDIFYWSGSAAEYCKLFDYTEFAFHAVLPQAQLSGPATTGPLEGSASQKFLRYFLEHCRSGVNFRTQQPGTRLDFVTFHVKGGGFPFTVPARTEPGNPSVESLLEQVRTGLAVIRECGFSALPVVLSEADPDGWAAGNQYDNGNMAFRNTEYYASYVAAAYCGIERLARETGMDVRPLAWAGVFPGETCFAGSRAFFTQGIEKPVFHAFQLFSKLGREKLALRCACPNASTRDGALLSGFATKEADSIRILLSSHCEDRDARGETPVRLVLKGLAPGSARLSCFRVDRTHANGYEEWLRQGSPLFPEGESYRAILQKASLGAPEESVLPVSPDGALRWEASLPFHCVWLLQVDPV